MTGSAEQIASVIPVIVVGGATAKITDSMFPGGKKAVRRRKSKKRKKSRRKK